MKAKVVDISLYSGFVLTGRDCAGKRFKRTAPGSQAGFMYLKAVNAWQGTFWGERKDTGKREKLWEIYN